MSVALKLKNCSVCGDEFEPYPTTVHKQHTCGSEPCKKEARARNTYRYKVETGAIKNPGSKMPSWTEGEIQYLQDHRFDSSVEISKTINRSKHTVRRKRSELGLPQQAVCTSCGTEFDKINQHSLCEACVPNQREYAENYRNNMNGKWQQYKGNAKKRDLTFNLPLTEFAEFWQKPCTYCGSEIETVGLDRIDSSQGYSKDNIVSCCSVCNEMKMARTRQEWVDHMKKVLTHMGEL